MNGSVSLQQRMIDLKNALKKNLLINIFEYCKQILSIICFIIETLKNGSVKIEEKQTIQILKNNIDVSKPILKINFDKLIFNKNIIKIEHEKDNIFFKFIEYIVNL